MKNHTPVFLFIQLLINVLNECTAKELHLCVIYEKTVSAREIKINLAEVLANGQRVHENVRQLVKNGENLEISFADDIEFKEFVFIFDIYVKPLENEYQPDANDQNPTDDQPFEFVYGRQIDDIRAMTRSVSVSLYEPKFKKRYTINLGKIDPPGLFWNRIVFVETENGKGKNCYLFLYALASKNRRQSFSLYENIFLGLAPLVKINGEAASSSSGKQFIEFHLSMPIDVNRLFKHNVLKLMPQIYCFEETTGNELLNTEQNSLAEELSEKRNNTEENECPICFNPLNSEKLTMKVHEDHNENSQHIFHAECLKEWIEFKGKVRCPLCNNEPTSVLSAVVQPIFNGIVEKEMFISSDSIGKLIRIANNDNDDEYRRTQAKIMIKKIKEFVDIREESIRNKLSKMGFLTVAQFIDGKKLFEVGAGGFEKHPNLRNIQLELANFRSSSELTAQQQFYVIMSLNEIKITLSEMNERANHNLEIIQLISEQQKLY